MSKKAVLLIMDGWGLGPNPSADAIQQANTPFVKNLYNIYPNATLTTFGEQVGLPSGQMGNSEVGHLNLGAGRIVYQELERINKAIADRELDTNKQLLASISYAKENNRPLHLIGLVSDGGVHSHIAHLKAICNICKAEGLTDVYIHAFMDGRDTDPKGGAKYVADLDAFLKTSVGKIATICGRYYAMDRDKRWNRVKLAYDLLVKNIGTKYNSVQKALQTCYDKNETDEFIKPIVITDTNNEPLARIKNGDAVLCFNFRTDRPREITTVLTQTAFPELDMEPLQLNFTTMTEYDKTYKGINVLFQTDDLKNTIGEVIAQNNLTQLRIAETEKYPHVTFFFSGGRELPFDGEKRIVAPSATDVATYDLKPEMSAAEITDGVLKSMQEDAPDFICLNFANADMVGHTGVFSAAIKAAETVDACVEKIVNLAIEKDYIIFLTADHGNSDYMINEDGSPNTAHTMNPVPYFIINSNFKGQPKVGKLADVAPTILHLMNLPIPAEMTGDILIY
jgi:2,3-bisphosphoglycerate-independent phosphoglycerate mutase